jgi:hypothetical protein
MPSRSRLVAGLHLTTLGRSAASGARGRLMPAAVTSGSGDGPGRGGTALPGVRETQVGEDLSNHARIVHRDDEAHAVGQAIISVSKARCMSAAHDQ